MLTKQKRRAERTLQAQALTRQAYKDKLLLILSAAITRLFMVKLAELNGRTKWVRHWASEVDRLINMDFVLAVLAPIKGNWDKRKAMRETLDDIRLVEVPYCRAAGRCLTKVYKLKEIKKDLPAGVEDEFYEMVYEIAERALSPDDGEE